MCQGIYPVFCLQLTSDEQTYRRIFPHLLAFFRRRTDVYYHPLCSCQQRPLDLQASSEESTGKMTSTASILLWHHLVIFGRTNSKCEIAMMDSTRSTRKEVSHALKTQNDTGLKMGTHRVFGVQLERANQQKIVTQGCTRRTSLQEVYVVSHRAHRPIVVDINGSTRCWCRCRKRDRGPLSRWKIDFVYISRNTRSTGIGPTKDVERSISIRPLNHGMVNSCAWRSVSQRLVVQATPRSQLRGVNMRQQ